ncbi:DHA2 family efflux MFS transporter permease subunit [Lapillicoccus sp.]|uniref:DHA2 family efflux MFS transporter permease subunit n=1 Tax=Lapillicoccus sp. TaxID=1909287 RepID=UPI0027C9407F|nr:DHA2 family efflux MFS transporter permease subunit [Actinomycetota bacterium]
MSPWMVLTVVLVADVMDLVDSTVANLAGPSIRADLGGGDATLQWVLAAYTTAFALGLVTSGRLGDLLGRRRMFLVGMAGFTLSSLACGLAPGVGWLIAARVLQGLFGAVMIPQGLALVKVVFPPQDLNKAFIPFGPVMGLAGVVGPIVAGLLINANLFGSQWRSIFLINVPIGMAAFVLSWLTLPKETGEQRDAKVDIGGVTLLTLASAMLIVPLVQGRELGWPAWTWVLMVGSLVVIAAFALSERRSKHPVIEPSLFANRSFVVGLLVIAAFFTALTGFTLAFNLFMQLGQGWTPLHSGLSLIPWAIATAIGAGLSGAFLAEKLGRVTLHLGVGTSAAGMLGLWWTIGHYGSTLTSWTLVPALLVSGLGAGLVFVPLFGYILGDVTEAEVGTGSGLLNAVQQFSAAIGVAALGTVFFQQADTGDFGAATQLVLVLAVVLYAVTFGLVFLLPRVAQEDHG